MACHGNFDRNRQKISTKKVKNVMIRLKNIVKIYLGNLYFNESITRQNIPNIEIMLRMAMHDRMETAVWTKSEWSPIDTSNDSSFITSFMNLKRYFILISNYGSCYEWPEVRKPSKYFEKRDYFLGEFDFWSLKTFIECQQSYARTGYLWIDDFFNLKGFFINTTGKNNFPNFQKRSKLVQK